MKIIIDGAVIKSYVLRFDAEEEVLSGLSQFCKDKGLTAAWFNFIGACSSVDLWYYNLDSKEYQKELFTENLEVTSVMGNIGVYENEPIIHCHGDFSKQDYTTIGGHINALTVSATIEVKLDVYHGHTINRLLHYDLCLKLMSKA